MQYVVLGKHIIFFLIAESEKQLSFRFTVNSLPSTVHTAVQVCYSVQIVKMLWNISIVISYVNKFKKLKYQT